MSAMSQMAQDELRELHGRLENEFETFRSQGLNLNMTRGKPSPEQLALSQRLLELPGAGNHTAADGTDCRNYGGLHGLPELRGLYAAVLDTQVDNVIVADNASLALMHDAIVFGLLKGAGDGAIPWGREPAVKFLCPAPGYDRHFAICEAYGIEMIPVGFDAEGPDMDQVEALTAEDASVKGMWCVPKYSNPTGHVYADSVVERLAGMRTAAEDFRIFWDNAYVVHHLTDERPALRNLREVCVRAGHPNRALEFASTSKVTFAGAGVGVLAASAENIAWFTGHMGKRTIGPDKVNQLRHAALLPDESALAALMDGHREVLAPKFRTVDEVLTRDLAELDVATWTRPKGGYFISVNTPPGCARRTVELAGQAGVVMTPAGAAFPYGDDPDDRNLRIAPSFPSLDEVEQASEGIALAIALAAAEKLLEQG